MAPATICMVMPSTQPIMMATVQAKSGSLRSTMTPKDWHAVFAVRGRTVRPTLVDRR